MMHTYNRTTRSGYSLVEVLVAISILLIAVVGPMTIAVKGIQSARYSKEQTTALFLAQEGIEMFVAMRNESMRDAIVSGTLATGWDWVSDSKLANCFTDDGQPGGDVGCNFDLSGLTLNDKVLNRIGTPKDCTTLTNCVLYYNATNNRSPYTVNSAGSVATPFTRIISVKKDAVDDGIIITSEVRWTTGLFGGGTRSVKLESALYRLYE